MLERIYDANRVSKKMIDDILAFLERRNEMDIALEYLSNKAPKKFDKMSNDEKRTWLFAYLEENVITYNNEGYILVN
jgi:hypothetical protein